MFDGDIEPLHDAQQSWGSLHLHDLQLCGRRSGKGAEGSQERDQVEEGQLVQSIQLLEYLRESEEFKLRLLARFLDFRMKVQAGVEKFKTYDILAKRLEAFDKDIGPNVDIPETQKDLAKE